MNDVGGSGVLLLYCFIYIEFIYICGLLQVFVVVVVVPPTPSGFKRGSACQKNKQVSFLIRVSFRRFVWIF